jgi:hypothetical protein
MLTKLVEECEMALDTHMRELKLCVPESIANRITGRNEILLEKI